MICSVVYKYFLFTCLLLFLNSNTKGDDNIPRNFIERYREVSNSLIVEDLKEAHRVADSLVRIAVTDEQKLKAHILLAKILELKGNIKESLYHALKADTISNSLINSSWIATTSSFLSTTFRQLGLLTTAASYLDKAEKTNGQLYGDLDLTLTSINILHNRASLNIEKKNYNLAIEQALSAAELLNEVDILDNEITLLQATTFKLLGICAYRLNNFSTADSLLHLSLEKLENFNFAIKPFIYRALADVSIERNNLDLALKYLQKVDRYLLSFESQELKILTYHTWLKFYKIQGDFPNFLVYSSSLKELENNKNKSTIEVLESLIQDLKSNQNRNNTLLKYVFIIISSIVFVIFSFIIVLKQRFQIVKIQKGSSSLGNKQEDITSNDDEKDHSTDNNNAAEAVEKKNERSINISLETVDRLYHELLYQEKIFFFLDKNMTLQELANRMGTNTRYVTYILNRFRGMSYYNYLQSIRIAYIKEQMNKTPKLLNMKVGELAPLCGFTNPSRFSVAFKEETGRTPSAFIKEIKNNKNK